MDHYPEIPTVDLAGRRDPFTRADLPPIPESYDRRQGPLIHPDAWQVPGSTVHAVYAVESRARPGAQWELRPHNEHRGGRSWSRHFGRINRIAGFWHYGALVFQTAEIAHQCAASLTELRRTAEIRFRVVEIEIVQRQRVLPGDYCPD